MKEREEASMTTSP